MAHKRSIFRSEELSGSLGCACFYCQLLIRTDRIINWTDQRNEKGKTDLCPNCRIDLILSNKFPIDDKKYFKEDFKKTF